MSAGEPDLGAAFLDQLAHLLVAPWLDEHLFPDTVLSYQDAAEVSYSSPRRVDSCLGEATVAMLDAGASFVRSGSGPPPWAPPHSSPLLALPASGRPGREMRRFLPRWAEATSHIRFHGLIRMAATNRRGRAP